MKILKKIEKELIKAKNEFKNLKLEKFIVTITTNTSKNINNPYLAPLRVINKYMIFGIIVYSRKQLISLTKLIDKFADLVFIDTEKKISYSIGDEYFKIYNKNEKKFSSLIKKEKKKTLEYIELGNLFSTAKLLIKNPHVYEFKPNDITTDHAWLILSNFFGNLGSKKISIIGSGNIGFKLSLKLVESGVTVNMFRRNINVNSNLANCINLVKPKSTLAVANAIDDKIKSCIKADAIVGCSNEINVIDEHMIKAMKPNGIILDVGKGNIKKSAIKFANKKNLKVIRCDITETLAHFINLYTNYMFEKNNYGRKKVNDFFVVSGGFLGKKNDIVVDNYKKPSQILGIADGSGKFKSKISKLNKRNIKDLKKKI